MVWENGDETIDKYRTAIHAIKVIVTGDSTGELARGRLKNQADFYSLVGALIKVIEKDGSINNASARERLRRFIAIVEDEEGRGKFKPANEYYAAARSASNDPGPRQTRIETVAGVIRGTVKLP
jgi:hypothetical protein